ncbi:MAG: malectin domain-containing carbohydrate-binding protein [Thermomicrobiales bacterium]
MLFSARWNRLTLVAVLMAMFFAAMWSPDPAAAGVNLNVSGGVAPATVARGDTVRVSVDLSGRGLEALAFDVAVLVDGVEVDRWSDVSVSRYRGASFETTIPVTSAVSVGSHSVAASVTSDGAMIEQAVLGTFVVESPSTATPAPTPTATSTPVPTVTGTPSPTPTATVAPTVTPTSTVAPTQPASTPSPTPSATAAQPGQSVVRVNVGGPALTDSRGLAWQADSGSSGGGTYAVNSSIAGTADDGLYASERWGEFSYSIPLENGSYDVRLLFAEIWFSYPGQRMFNVSLNGARVLTDFDILSETAPMTALDKHVPVNVTGGVLQIAIARGAVDYPKLSGFEVIRTSGSANPTPTATATPAPTATATATPTTPTQPASIQALVDSAAPGSTVVVPAGVYRESISISKPITLRGEPGAVIDGESRNTWIVGFANGVTIEGFEFLNTSNSSQFGGLRNNGYSDWTIRGNTFRDAGAVSIDIRQGSNIRILDNDIRGSGQLGIRLEAVDSGTVSGNSISGSNQAGRFDPGWEAGGIKMSSSSQQTRNVVIEGNEIFNNNGPGVWSDVSSTDITIRNNRLHHNARQGVLFELSFRGRIHGNVIYNNGGGFDAWGFGAGIVLQNSKDTEVYDNVVAWNEDGISIISQNRGSQWNDVTENYVHDNVIIMSHDSGWNTYAMAWLEDWNGPLTSQGSNNRGQNNRFWFDTPDGSELRWRWKDTPYWRLADFARTPGGTGSSYLTTEQKNQILAESGL